MTAHPPKMIILDMDSSLSLDPLRTRSRTAYNGHLGSTGYHGLFLFEQCGDLESFFERLDHPLVLLHSADGRAE